MKSKLVLIFLFVSLNVCGQQAYVSLGYTVANTSLPKAYYPHSSYQPLPSDLTTLDFSKDAFFFGNWHFNMGFVSERFFFDSNLSWLGQTLCTALYTYITEKDVKPNHQSGIGKLRKIQDNLGLNDSTDGFGIDANMWSMELAFGKRFMVGGYFGTSSLGVTDNSTHSGGGAKTAFTPHNYIYGNLDLGLHYLLGDDEIKILTSVRGGRLRVWKSSHDGEYKRNGFEIYPSVKAWIGEEAGIYVEMFYKYRQFTEKTVIDHWSNNADGTMEGVLPSFSSHNFGLTVGAYVPYWNQ